MVVRRSASGRGRREERESVEVVWWREYLVGKCCGGREKEEEERVWP